jgi:hypothetical protein
LCQTNIKAFRAKVDQSLDENPDGRRDYVDLRILRKHFQTDAWKNFQVDDSKISKILNHYIFRLDDLEGEGLVATETLMAYAVLMCQGSPQHKAEEFYLVI